MASELSLAPKFVLATVIAVEASNARRNKTWGYRFTGYDPASSIILSEVSQDESHQARHLTEFHLRRFGAKPAPPDSSLLRAILNLEDVPNDHFLVVDEPTGRLILEAALQAEQCSCTFYEHVLANTEDRTLRQIYEPMVNYETDHVRVLKERLESY